jgi:hypothetical protein
MVQLDLKKHTTRNKRMYVSNDDYVVSVEPQWTNRKIGKIVSLYQRELFKKIPGLYVRVFCTQSVNEGLKTFRCGIFFLYCLLYYKISPSQDYNYNLRGLT